MRKHLILVGEGSRIEQGSHALQSSPFVGVISILTRDVLFPKNTYIGIFCVV